MNGMVHLRLEALRKLLMALAVTLEVDPEELAAAFNHPTACQEFYEKLIEPQKEGR